MSASVRLGRLGLAASAALVLLLGACGNDGSSDDKDGAKDTTKKAESKPTPTPTPELIRGTYKPQPGQSDKVQSTLEAAGFECSRHSDKRMDLRLCSKGVKVPKAEYRDATVTEGYVRFAADLKGTVVLAAFSESALTTFDQTKSMRTEMLGAILPAEDAAIVEADGGTLSWGRYVKGLNGESFLVANGADARAVLPLSKPFTKLTKEQAFAKLRTKLKCSFGEPMDVSGESKETTLTCLDPTFESADEDGSIAGATAQLMLRESKQPSTVGLESLTLEGSHASVPDDFRAVKGLTPHFAGISTEPNVPAIADWVTAHLDDGVPHTAYVGDQIVSISVTTESMTGDAVKATANPERMALGLPGKDGGIDPPQPDGGN